MNFFLIPPEFTQIVSTVGAVTRGGEWPNCTMQIVPSENANGTTTIAVGVKNGGDSRSYSTFTFNVLPINDAPNQGKIILIPSPQHFH